MATRIGKPLIDTKAIRKARLTDFPTGKSDLQPEHRAWLDDMASFAVQQPNYYLDIIGFASKTGSTELNEQLSQERVASVLHYLENKDPRFLKRVRHLESIGEGGYKAPESDNSSEWRAVEVHFYLSPPRAPGGTKDPRPPLPGGPRFTNWSTAAVFGVQGNILPGIVLAGNLVVFQKNDPPIEERWYLVPQCGFGFSLTPPVKRKLWDVLQRILGSANYSGINLTPFTPLTPFSFADLELATCNMISGGGGVGDGYQYARMSVRGKTWFYDRFGRQQRGMEKFFTDVDVGGPTAMYGAGASLVEGPLLQM